MFAFAGRHSADRRQQICLVRACELDTNFRFDVKLSGFLFPLEERKVRIDHGCVDGQVTAQLILKRIVSCFEKLMHYRDDTAHTVISSIALLSHMNSKRTSVTNLNIRASSSHLKNGRCA